MFFRAKLPSDGQNVKPEETSKVATSQTESCDVVTSKDIQTISTLNWKEKQQVNLQRWQTAMTMLSAFATLSIQIAYRCDELDLDETKGLHVINMLVYGAFTFCNSIGKAVTEEKIDSMRTYIGKRMAQMSSVTAFQQHGLSHEDRNVIAFAGNETEAKKTMLRQDTSCAMIQSFITYTVNTVLMFIP